MRKFQKLFKALVLSAITLGLCACGAPAESQTSSATTSTKPESEPQQASSENTPTLTLIGHSSVKVKTSDGKVIYIDPAYQKTTGAYDEPADIVLVTHAHSDHNGVWLVTQNDGCTVITNAEALPEKGSYQSFEVGGVKIEAVPAENTNHSIDSCVGYVLTFDGLTVYHAGDTSTLDALTEKLSGRSIDYAMYPIDGVYNMDAAEATALADTIGAENNIPMHIKGYTDPYDEEMAKTFTPKGALYVGYGETITLS